MVGACLSAFAALSDGDLVGDAIGHAHSVVRLGDEVAVEPGSVPLGEEGHVARLGLRSGGRNREDFYTLAPSPRA